MVSCAKEKAESGTRLKTLVYAGDILMGNELGGALVDERARGRIFGNTAKVLREADVALVNAEGVISAGGEFFDKKDYMPHYFRAAPSFVETLTAAGIDIASVGNNHAVDYGRPAFLEMLDRLRGAGIEYTGGGADAKDAMRPGYVRAGDLVLAFIGFNMTSAPNMAAAEDRPGTLHFEPFRSEASYKKTLRTLTDLRREAARHADLVFLTPHWGKGWTSETQPEIRRFAADLIRAGFDGILGHSSHQFHGAEVVDGRPVLYDAGNFVVYWTNDKKPWNRGLLYELKLDGNGVRSVAARPLRLTENRTDFARDELSKDILGKFAKLSSKMGLDVEIRDGRAEFRCNPPEKKKAEISEEGQRPVPSAVRLAPSFEIIDAVPPSATPLDARFSNGARLVAAEILPRELPVKRGALYVALYWQTDAPISDNLKIRLRVLRTGADGATLEDRMDHLPGNWLAPTDGWPLRPAVIQDRTVVRLKRASVGQDVEVWVGLGDLEPVEGGALTLRDKMFLVGRGKVVAEGKWFYELFADRERPRGGLQ